jgi:hypothetical protein
MLQPLKYTDSRLNTDPDHLRGCLSILRVQRAQGKKGESFDEPCYAGKHRHNNNNNSDNTPGRARKPKRVTFDKQGPLPIPPVPHPLFCLR